MARNEDHARAIELRRQGKTYSEIKAALNVGKGTLSVWLREYPLSPQHMDELRAGRQRSVERFRRTMRTKRQDRLSAVYERVKEDMNRKNVDPLFVAGFYLYWAEGGKTKPYTVMIANTDCTMLVCFLEWVQLLGWDRARVKVRLQLYADMDVDAEVRYWKRALHLPSTCFRKPYMKKTKRADITYKGGYAHGTCNLIIDNRDLAEYVLMGVKYLQQRYSGSV